MKAVYSNGWCNLFYIVLLIGGISCNGEDFNSEKIDDDYDNDDTDFHSDTVTGIDAQLGIGKSCETSKDCFPEIICSGIDKTCQYPGTLGTFPEDAPCAATLYCSVGLVCAANETCQKTGDPGTGQIGDGCTQHSDCGLHLACKNDVCDGYEAVYWEGAKCETLAEDGEFTAFFDVKRESGEFYRFPFPNDALNQDGHINLEGHVDPGVLNEKIGNPVAKYIAYMEDELDGYGTQSNIYFRLSHKPDWNSLALMENLYILNIDPASRRYGKREPTGYAGNTAEGMYICGNWLSLKPSMGRPLAANTTYAAIIETSIRDLNGASLHQSKNFAAMLSDETPGDAQMKNAWQAYSPLREFLDSDEDYDRESIAVAAVFTTQQFNALPALRSGVRSEKPPVLVDNNVSFESTSDGYMLYTGKITVPFYQAGTRPFFQEGGEVVFDSSGEPIWVEDDEVPFALTVPIGIVPTEGWPIFLYAHGTGGSEKSFINNSVAQRMAEMGIAVISLLQVQHGDRRGIPAAIETEETAPGVLFYNFLNPYAALGNNYQAAADYFQLVRLVESFATVTGEDVVFDTNKLYYFGHSQGTQGQFLAAVHEPLIKGILLSGAGGYLIDSMLNKKNPQDISAIVQYILMDPNVDNAHPVLSLMQATMEQVDPVNHRLATYRNEWPNMTYPPRDVMMIFGILDSYTPEPAQASLAKALKLDMDTVAGHGVSSTLEEIDDFPFSASHEIEDTEITTIGVQYFPNGDYDGHFVTFQHPKAISQWTHFVATMVNDQYVAELISQ